MIWFNLFSMAFVLDIKHVPYFVNILEELQMERWAIISENDSESNDIRVKDESLSDCILDAAYDLISR